jgi:hypothetical protein
MFQIEGGRRMNLIGSAMILGAVCLLVPAVGRAEDVHLLDIGVRAGFSGNGTLIEQTTEKFQQYDAFAIFALPWERYSESGWGARMRLLASAGALRAAGRDEFVTTLVPGIALGDKEGRISFELGGGMELLSGYKFGSQNLGGPLMWVWDTSIRTTLYRGLKAGYWLHHVSDATMYGGDTRGYDLHMFEIGYRF